jgi:hypothetical protein
MVSFQTKNPNLGKFWRAQGWKMLIYFKLFGIFYRHWGYFVTIWYILCSFGTFFPAWVIIEEKNLATLIANAPSLGRNVNRVTRTLTYLTRHDCCCAYVQHISNFIDLIKNFLVRVQ